MGLRAPEVQALAGTKEGCRDEMDFAAVMRPPSQIAPPMSSSSSPWWQWKGLRTGSRSISHEDQQNQTSGAREVLTQVPLGSVRVSLGWASTFEDAYALVEFLKGCLE